MDDIPFPDEPFVESVLHPSDFSLASENAFVHALAIALVRKTEFTILHTGEPGQSRRQFPAVRTTLERWGMLEPGSPRSAVFEQLAVQVTKVSVQGQNPLEIHIIKELAVADLPQLLTVQPRPLDDGLIGSCYFSEGLVRHGKLLP